MITITVNYEDFDNLPQTRQLWFHMNRDDVRQNHDLHGQLLAARDIFQGEKREITIDEINQLLALVKRFIRISYGVRHGAKGERFRRDDETWADFFETPAYEEFLEGLFSPDPSKAFEFMLNVMPQRLVAEAEAEVAKSDPEVYAQYKNLSRPVEPAPYSSPEDEKLREMQKGVEALGEFKAEHPEVPVVQASIVAHAEDHRPAWMREGREPTQAELASMSPAELAIAWRMKAGG